MSAKTYFLHALTPLHPGTGQGHGLIDLPVARDVSTNHPVLYGSSLKGVLRDAARPEDRSEKNGVKYRDSAEINRLFGPQDSQDGDSASPLRLTDARLLCLPVRADKGTFAWVTCPLVLQRLLRDRVRGLPPSLVELEQGLAAKEGKEIGALVSKNSVVAATQRASTGDTLTVTLAELPLRAAAVAGSWATALATLIFPTDADWRAIFEKRFVVVSDDTFTWLAETATEVRAQIRVDPVTGTVEKGALWYSEVLPAETILAGTCEVLGIAGYSPDQGWKSLAEIVKKNIQVGGKATTGLGQARVVFAEVTK